MIPSHFIILVLGFLLTCCASASVSKKEILNIQASLIKIYTAKLKTGNEKIRFINLWDDLDDTYARPWFNLGSAERIVMVGGGILQSQYLTHQGATFLFCHELAHHFGGAPYRYRNYGKFNNFPGKMSSEGQADYYAAKSCMAEFFTQHTPDTEVSKSISQICESKTSTAVNMQACAITISGGYNFLFLQNLFSNNKEKMSLSKKSLFVVKKTIRESRYPSLQCRLDTVVAGALSKPRPKCWFATDKASAKNNNHL